ncbi:putative harbinger transposase-derived protein [Helianthus annuus]|nr:putative harbinger transposase-derived protein [Helianthus annuus]
MIQQLARAFEQKKLRYIMYACLILHNLIIEYDGKTICEYDPNDIHGNVEPVEEQQQQSNLWMLRNEHMHGNLCVDLVDYIWNNFRVDHVDDE